MKLRLQTLNHGDESLSKTVKITDEEYKILSKYKGFPNEIDPWGRDEIPDWVSELMDRNNVKGIWDACLVYY